MLIDQHVIYPVWGIIFVPIIQSSFHHGLSNKGYGPCLSLHSQEVAELGLECELRVPVGHTLLCHLPVNAGRSTHQHIWEMAVFRQSIRAQSVSHIEGCRLLKASHSCLEAALGCLVSGVCICRGCWWGEAGLERGLTLEGRVLCLKVSAKSLSII